LRSLPYLAQPHFSLKTWNEPGSNLAEDYSYDDLYENEKSGANLLGLGGDIWDCQVNHYLGCWWKDLEERGLDQYVKVLGWDEDRWNHDGPVPDTDDVYWDDLTQEQQEAAIQICYFRELWDNVPIPEWPQRE
jgi:hypothetical protein